MIKRLSTAAIGVALVLSATSAQAAPYFGFDGRNSASSIHQLWGTGLDLSGGVVWSNFPSSTIEAKGRLSAIRSTLGFAILSFICITQVYIHT